MIISSQFWPPKQYDSCLLAIPQVTCDRGSSHSNLLYDVLTNVTPRALLWFESLVQSPSNTADVKDVSFPQKNDILFYSKYILVYIPCSCQPAAEMPRGVDLIRVSDDAMFRNSKIAPIWHF